MPGSNLERARIIRDGMIKIVKNSFQEDEETKLIVALLQDSLIRMSAYYEEYIKKGGDVK